ncbi:sigma 54-interacting transcriptional regulator [Duganella alba]|jgi:two-component system nitrogen regulation response regulator GlnG|nr:sigma 54-interacting transcriptional regulator [Duganella alba]
MNADDTLTSSVSMPAVRPPSLLGLTLLWHPDPSRAGQQCVVPSASGLLALQRHEPLFQSAGQAGAALEHRCIARAPLLIARRADDSVQLTLPDSAMSVAVDGNRLTERETVLTREQIGRGAVLELGGHVLLCLHWMGTPPVHNPLPGVLGVSTAAAALRTQIRQVAQTELPALLLGETGTGKDVAARAIHAASRRGGRPFVAVNMAALTESLAAADLFGAVKGAYTGAQHARAGLFSEASDGTLFLDEIGDTPAVIQPMLLRVLENGEYRPLGARQNAHSAARLIAATDQDLGARAFNQALLRRMEGYVIRLPALRERREDIGLLLYFFLRQWNEQNGLDVQLPVALVSALCREDWPGNIRQLGQVVRRLALMLAAGETPQLAALLAPVARSAVAASAPVPPPVPAATPKSARAKLNAFSEQTIVDAMESTGWQIQSAARTLGISRPSLYKLLETHPQIRRVETIPIEELRQALQQHATDLVKCASMLRTPGEALRRHLRVIGLLA